MISKNSFTVNKLVLPLLILYLFSGVFLIDTNETGVTTRFGRLVNSRIEPGIHYCLPYPFERLYKVKTTTVFKMALGFDIRDRLRGLQPIPEQMEWLTGDTNIIDIQLIVQYGIIEPAAYLFSARKPERILRNLVESSLTRLVSQKPVHDVLTGSRALISEKVKSTAQDELDEKGIGILIKSISLVRAEPPDEVSHAFADVINAKADRERLINQAVSYRNQVIPKARGEGTKLLAEADADKTAMIEHAKGEAASFSSLQKEYRKGKELTMIRLYLESMERILKKAKIYIVQPSEKNFNLKLIDLPKLRKITR